MFTSFLPPSPSNLSPRSELAQNYIVHTWRRTQKGEGEEKRGRVGKWKEGFLLV